MKKLKVFSRLLLFVMALTLVFVAAACFNNTEANPPKVESITLNQTTAEITLGEELDYSKFTVTVHYDDATKNENLPLTAEMITEGLSSLNTVGVHPLTVTAKGKTATLTVTVNPAPKAAVSISLNKSSAEITVGDDINYSEFTVTVNYDDGTQDSPIALEEKYITDGLFNLGTVGTHELTVTVMGKTATLTVKVNPLVMTGAAMANITKTYDGQPAAMNPTGLPAGAQVAYTYYAGEAADESKKVESAVDAGTYFVKAVVSATNYEDKELTATITINKQHISVNNVIWSNTGCRYTGEEVTLAAKATNLPEYITYTFTAKEGGAAKATESGYYTAVAHFTSTNNNYSVDASCELTWRIIQNTSLAFAPWYGAENGQLLVATFEEFENSDKLVLHLGEETVTGTVAYTDVITVTFPAETGYTLTVNEGAMSVTKGNKTTYLLSETVLNNFVGEYSTLAEDIKVVLDLENATLKLVLGTVNNNLTIKVVDSDAQLTVDDTDIVLTYNAEQERVKFNGYANPADFNQVDTNGIYLLTKEEVDELKGDMATGTFVDYKAAHSLSVAADKTFKYDGKSVQPFAVYYVATSSYYTSGMKLYISINTNSRKNEIKVYEVYYNINISYYDTVFIPADYKNFIGTYYQRDDAGFDKTEKISFMEYQGYYRVIVGSTNYDLDKTELSFSLTEGVLTATLTKGEAEPVTVTFNGGASVTYNGKTYHKISPLIAAKSYSNYKFISGSGKVVMYDDSTGTFTIDGSETKIFTTEYTEDGLKVTVTVDEAQKVIIYGADTRYITVDGEIYIYNDLASVSNGRATAYYYHGEDRIDFTSSTGVYALKINGTTSNLTDVVYSIVDDGNNNGRTVIKAVGKIGNETYTILHYSLAAILVNDVVYTASNFVDIMGSEFKPTADSEDVFAFTEDGKMTFRGEEIFLNGTNTNTNFNLGNYFYSFDISKTSIRFNDKIVWNIDYYFTAYFDFNGAYLSADGTKVFVFDASTVYYNGTNTTSFTAKGTETGAKVTISSKDAIFTKVQGGAHTLVYDGVTYTKVTNFSLAPYFGTYTVFDGNNGGTTFELKVEPSYSDKKISTFVIYNGNITPVVDGTGATGIYLIKNTDAATSAKLPILAVQKKFVDLLGTTTLNGKTLEVVLEAVPKANSTDYVTAVNVKYDGKSATISGSWTFEVTLNDIKYILQVNEDSATKAQLPILVFEAWWDDFDGTHTYNGKTLKVEISVDASGEAPVPALKFTYDNEVVTATVTDVEGGKQLTFVKGGVNYKGVMSGTDIAVYSETEFTFFFADQFKHTVNEKELVLTAQPTRTATEFNLASSSYDGKALTFAKYLPESNVVVFANADGYFAYDIVADQFYANIVAEEDQLLLGLNYRSNASYGQPLYYTTITSEISSFDKDTGKMELKVKMGGFTLYDVTSITPVAGKTGEYIVVGKTYNSSSTDVTVYLIIDGANVTLAMAEEYSFPGTYTVNEKSLVIAKSGSGYTASYDGSDAVAVTPDFSNRNFVLNTTDKTYVVKWTFGTDFTFTVTEVPAEVLAFEGYGYAYFNGVSGYPYELDIKFKQINSNGKYEFNIEYEMGSASGTVTGTLSDNGKYFDVTINRNNVWVFKNATNDYDTEFLMLTSCNARNFPGEYTVGESKVVIGIGVESDYDYDDEFDGFNTPKFVVTLDGKACTVATAWSTSASSIEFTCEGKTYTATYASGSVTVAEKAA